MRTAIVAGLVVALAACGGEKAKTADTAIRATPDAAAKVRADSVAGGGAKADSVRGDTATGTAMAKKPAGPLRDSAFGPTFSVDSSGKVTRIKPPAKKP